MVQPPSNIQGSLFPEFIYQRFHLPLWSLPSITSTHLSSKFVQHAWFPRGLRPSGFEAVSGLNASLFVSLLQSPGMSSFQPSKSRSISSKKLSLISLNSVISFIQSTNSIKHHYVTGPVNQIINKYRINSCSGIWKISKKSKKAGEGWVLIRGPYCGDTTNQQTDQKYEWVLGICGQPFWNTVTLAT